MSVWPRKKAVTKNKTATADSIASEIQKNKLLIMNLKSVMNSSSWSLVTGDVAANDADGHTTDGGGNISSSESDVSN
jgi:hypothetical protein